MTKRKLLQLFIDSKKKCYYCGRKTRMPKQNYTAQYTPPDLATVEHIYTRMDIRRFLSSESVLSCWSCNQEKAHRDYCLVFNNGDYQYKDYGLAAQLKNGLLINLYNGDYHQITA